MRSHNICFHEKKKKEKISVLLRVHLFKAILSNFFAFIEHKSRMISFLYAYKSKK